LIREIKCHFIRHMMQREQQSSSIAGREAV
jgi:hypothetical protein